MMVQPLRVDVAVRSEDRLGEGLFWDAENQVLVRVDILSATIHQWHHSSNHGTNLTLPKEVSLAIPRLGGGIVATQVDHVVVASTSGAIHALCVIDEGNPSTRLNDGICDSAGRLWVGTYSTRGEPEASLYLVSVAGEVTQVLDDLIASNGLAWTADGNTLYVTDTGRRTVDEYRLHTDRASLVRVGTIVETAGDEGVPDGITIDTEGGLWVTMFGGGCVRRYLPDGTLDVEVPTPVTHPTSVEFGGPDLRTLYITTSRHHLTPDQLLEQADAGSVLSCSPGHAGRAAHKFAG